jgi:hypothetical protein
MPRWVDVNVGGSPIVRWNEKNRTEKQAGEWKNRDLDVSVYAYDSIYWMPQKIVNDPGTH